MCGMDWRRHRCAAMRSGLVLEFRLRSIGMVMIGAATWQRCALITPTEPISCLLHNGFGLVLMCRKIACWTHPRIIRCRSSLKTRITNRKDGGLLYSTDGGRMCPACRQPIDRCSCSQKKPGQMSDGVVRVSRQTKGRNGKDVTVIKGLALEPTALALLGRQLKTACGAGARLKTASSKSRVTTVIV